MERVAIVGGPGAGKTSLARALGLPHVELDAPPRIVALSGRDPSQTFV
jgi:adenylate kinase family enzyme